MVSDQLKYDLRSALKLPLAIGEIPGKKNFSNQLARISAAQDLLQECNAYEQAMIGRSIVRCQEGRIEFDKGVYRIVIPESELRNQCLERLTGNCGSISHRPISDRLIYWLSGNGEMAKVLPKFKNMSFNDKGVFERALKQSVIARVNRRINNPPRLIPSTWNVFGLSGSEAVMCLWVLTSICICHLARTIPRTQKIEDVFSSIRFLPLVISFDKLCKVVSSVSRVEIQRTFQFLRKICYGVEVNSPDPALQPLISFGEDNALLLPQLFLSGNLERNLLVLQARIDDREFNRQSQFFEGQMTERVANLFIANGYQVQKNHKFSGHEIDLSAWKPGDSHLLILELKWMLQPGEAIETIRRKEKLNQAQGQLKIRVNAVSEKLQEYSRQRLAKENWDHVIGAIVSEGFSNCVHENDYPNISLEMLSRVLPKSQDAESLFSSLKEMPWLPKSGVEFNACIEELAFGGLSFEMTATKPNPQSESAWLHRWGLS